MSAAYRRTQRLLVTGFSLAILSLAFVGVVTRKSANEFVRTADQVERHQQTLSLLTEARRALTRAESEQRGFLITGREQYLSNFDETPDLLDSAFRRLNETMTDGESVADFKNAEELASQKYDEMAGSLALYRAGRKADALRVMMSDEGLKLMNSFRAEVGAIEDREKRSLRQAATANLANRDSLSRTMISGLTVAVVAVLLSMIMVTRDARRRQLAEQSLQSALALQRSIFDSVDAAIIATDARGNVTHFNRVAERWLGHPAAEVVGANDILQRIHDAEEVAAATRELSEQIGEAVDPDRLFAWLPSQGLTYEREWTFIRRDGSRFPVWLSISSLAGIDGESIGLVGIAKDLTKEKADRAQLDQYLADFADKNRELELSAEELKQSRDVALSATRTKSEFLANMSHEIRTPMNGVMGMAHLLQSTTLNDRQRDFVRTIIQSAESLLTILNDILDLSKMEAGKMTLEHFPFDLRVTVEDLCESVAPVAHAKGLELNCLVPVGVPEHLMGDSGRLRQVLANLVANALKFTEQGEVSVSVQLIRSNANRATYRFCVIDTGIGIPLARQDGIFESFTQADGSTTRRFGGTGLGLTISRQFVELMGGTMGLISEEGKGSEFWFEMTFQRQDIPVVDGPKKEDLQGRRILIADDNTTNRAILRELLGSWHCTVEEAVSGQEALELAKHFEYDCAVLDMHMPGFDGVETARELRRDARTANLPLVLLSSSGFNPEDVEAASLFTVVLFKPVRSSPLYNALVHVTGGHVPDTREARPASPLGQADKRLRGLRVLVVEDNVVNQMVATELLDTWGCVAITADNGAAAVGMLDSERFDVVLMDVQMPVMDGFEATAEIRRLEEQRDGHRHIPIVAMTANAMSGDRERCLRAGMDSYLAKPLRPGALLEKLLEIVGSVESEEVVTVENSQNELLVFEPSRLDEACAGKTSLKLRVIERYVATSTTAVNEIVAASEAGDPVRAGTAAHGLKGSSLTVGSPLVSSLCAEVEAAGREGRTDDDAVQKLGPAMERLHQVLESYVTELKQT